MCIRDRAQAQAALDFNNAKRHDVGVAPLQWSTKLAAVAQNWADHLAKDEEMCIRDRLHRAIEGSRAAYKSQFLLGEGAP